MGKVPCKSEGSLKQARTVLNHDKHFERYPPGTLTLRTSVEKNVQILTKKHPKGRKGWEQRRLKLHVVRVKAT